MESASNSFVTTTLLHRTKACEGQESRVTQREGMKKGVELEEGCINKVGEMEGRGIGMRKGEYTQLKEEKSKERSSNGAS